MLVDPATLPDGMLLLALNDNAAARSPRSPQSAVVNPTTQLMYTTCCDRAQQCPHARTWTGHAAGGDAAAGAERQRHRAEPAVATVLPP